MKQFFSVLMVVVALFIGCESERQETTIIQHEIGNDFLTTESGVIIFGTHQDPVQVAIQTWVPGRVLSFKIEGNFTGSGNREIIGFYELRNFTGINRVFCFVLDSSGENIESVHEINFITGEFLAQHEARTGLSSELGGPIVHRGRVIGRFGDFNNNGRDELYFFRLSGIDFVPRFFEFNGVEFVEILELDWIDQASIVAIDPVDKTITLSERRFPDRATHGGYIDMIEEINTYIWNEPAQRYVLLSSEVRNFIWDRDLREWEKVQ